MYKEIQVNVEEKIKVVKEVYEKIAYILAKVATYDKDKCYDFRVIFKGSTYEGLKIGNPDEFDFGLIKDSWTGKISLEVDGNTPNGSAYAVPIIKICLEKFKIPGTKHLDASKVRGHLRDLVEQAIIDLGMKDQIKNKPREGGPAVTFEIRWPGFGYISIDLTIALELTEWPPEPIANPRPIGTNAKIELVPRVKKEPFPNTAFWQISTAQVETQMIKAMDGDGGCRRKVLQLTKYFKAKTRRGWYPLATYHLKTILLHLNDKRKRPEDWAQGMLVPRFKEFIDRLLEHLQNRSLPNFFIPAENLFTDRIDFQLAIAGVNDFLKTLWLDPGALLSRREGEIKLSV